MEERPIAYVQGSFDVIHRGHITLLSRCRDIVGKGTIIVALLTDDAYEKYRGYKPTQSYEERYAVLSSLKYVDQVVSCDNQNTKQQIQSIQPDFCVLGSDWVAKDIYKQWNVTPEFIDPYLLFVPYTKGISSTQIKERIKNGSD